MDNMKEIRITNNYFDGNILKEIHYYIDIFTIYDKQPVVYRQKHRLSGPASIVFKEDGNLMYKGFYIYDENMSEEDYYNHPLVQEYKLNQLINQQLTYLQNL